MANRIGPDKVQKIIEMYTTPAPDGSWVGCQSISRELGITLASVQNILKRNGINMRSPTEAHSKGKRCKPVKNLPSGNAPLCKCGCGNPVAWNQRRNQWNVYVVEHQHKDAPYKSSEWLFREYITNQKTLGVIARECGVGRNTIRIFTRKFNIPVRSQKEALVLSGAVRGSRNPAWKGGIAKWEYASGWKRIARNIRKRDNYACQICFTQFPKSSKLLHVHHKDGNKFNNDGSNLVTVCATCHPKGKRKEHWESPV